jgi:hypothetical protein
MGVFPVYRVGMGKDRKNSGIVIKIRLGNRKRTRQNSGIVGNFPQGERKHLPVHETFSTAASVI